jgi:hypothetical protein
MKIKIGPYLTWWGPYQIAKLLRYVGVNDDRCYLIGKRLSETKLNDVCQWIYDKRKRKIKIKIDDYDVWNMDGTLAIIILPMLKKLRDVKHGSPNVDDSDVPDELKSTVSPAKTEYESDGLVHERWEWVLNEIIWTFEQMQPDYDWKEQYCTGVYDCDLGETGFKYGPNHTHKRDEVAIISHSTRIQKGLILFGKYYQGLWD